MLSDEIVIVDTPTETICVAINNQPTRYGDGRCGGLESEAAPAAPRSNRDTAVAYRPCRKRGRVIPRDQRSRCNNDRARQPVYSLGGGLGDVPLKEGAVTGPLKVPVVAEISDIEVCPVIVSKEVVTLDTLTNPPAERRG